MISPEVDLTGMRRHPQSDQIHAQAEQYGVDWILV